MHELATVLYLLGGVFVFVVILAARFIGAELKRCADALERLEDERD